MDTQDKVLLRDIDIDPEVLMADFGYKTINRGKDYFVKNKVLSLSPADKLGDGSLKISGVVSGSRGNVYQCELEIQSDLFSTEVESTCDCPVYADCKHGIALLFAYLYSTDTKQADYKTPELTDQKKIDDWFKFISESEKENKDGSLENYVIPPEQNHQSHVIYIISYFTSQFSFENSGLVVNIYKAKKLKKGGYGKEYKLNFFDEVAVNSYSNVFCTYLDEDIVNALKGLESNKEDYYELGSAFYLSGEYGEVVLKQLLKTGRCFWETQKSSPLKEGLPRKINLYWQEKNSHLISRFKTDPVSHGLYTVESFHYYDDINKEFGLVKHDSLTVDQIIYHLDAPDLPKEMADQVSEKLITLLPEADLPLPGQTDIKRIDIKTPPICHLKLHAVPIPIENGESRLLHLASASFEYEGIIVKPDTLEELNKTLTTKIENKIQYRIHHDNTSQNQALARLKRSGLKSLDPELSPYGILDMAMYGEYSLAESIQNWDVFKTLELSKLEAEGWNITIDDSYSLEIEYIDEWQAELEESEGGDWFEMSLGFELGGKKINMLPLVVELISRYKNTELLHQSLKQKEYELLNISAHQWVKIPSKRLLLILDSIVELYDTASLNKKGNLEFSKHAGLHYGDLLNDPKLCWKGADELKALNDKINNFSGIKKAPMPEGIKATLRDYQTSGYDWMQFLREYQLNGILADDMGLGKTLQALCSILLEKKTGRAQLPSLVIAPTSLMSNWKNEVEKFTPEIKILILQGPDRKEKFSKINDYDLILTTYPLMIRDTEIYTEQAFHYLMLDEAQAIKNAKSKTTQIIFKIKANHRLCITGTPIENHLGELWSMFHFIMPGYLGTHEKFTKLFRTPIAKNGDTTRSEQLRKRIQPFMLRRTKDLVAKELPEKTEIIRKVSLTGKQRDLYETVRLAMDKKVRDEISKKGLARSHIMILDALLKLRQVCCDPQLVKLAKAKKVKESAKLEMLMTMVPEMVDEGRKILIFSQFTTMLAIIEKALNKAEISYSKLTGQTRKREDAINAFQNGNASVFLISLKAGGVGLNLTAADTVIHYDPWWNPAVENQATDRAYRIGQDKPVFVYKLLTEDTVEEKILQLQEKKKDIADSMYKGTGGKKLSFGQNELMDLLRPLE